MEVYKQNSAKSDKLVCFSKKISVEINYESTIPSIFPSNQRSGNARLRLVYFFSGHIIKNHHFLLKNKSDKPQIKVN